MRFKILLFLALALVLSVPFLLRQQRDQATPDEVLVVIAPHTEAVRYEFSTGFEKWYRKKRGRSVAIDWRVIGGTNEIVYYVNSSYLSAFRYYWETQLGRKWNLIVQESFGNHLVQPGPDPQSDTLAESARRAFLSSRIGIGIDVIFGGGVTDYVLQAQLGHLVDSGILDLHPEWFGGEEGIPQTFSGDEFWDLQGRWVGTALNLFGIAYNTDSLQRLGYPGRPERWEDLADPHFWGEVALSDPTKSGAVAKAYEMVVQYKIQQARLSLGLTSRIDEQEDPQLNKTALELGWLQALQLLQQTCANARYFTDAAGKPVISVSNGDCAICQSIAFYARFQQETNRLRGGKRRFEYFTPVNGTSVSVDPIAMLRGAKNPQLALDFIEYVLSLEGQKIIHHRVGTPGGPERYQLGRTPIRRELYGPEYLAFAADTENRPYEHAAGFVYHPEWTLPIFDVMRFVFKVAFIDVHEELKSAWKAILKAQRKGHTQRAERALEVFSDMSLLSYDRACGSLHRTIKSRNRIDEVRLADSLSSHFKQQYLRAKAIAQGKEPIW